MGKQGMEGHNGFRMALRRAGLVVRAAVRWQGMRKEFRELLDRDDRLLDDIGLTRARAEALAAQCRSWSAFQQALREISSDDGSTF